jgi:hypothetical protein
MGIKEYSRKKIVVKRQYQKDSSKKTVAIKAVGLFGH